jgi:hypothetical protein
VEFLQKDEAVHTILADNEFQSLKDDVEEMDINVNLVIKEEHVPKVERQNRVIKERARAIVQMLPYRKIPKKIRITLKQYVVFWLNNVPKENQVSSPREMIMGEETLDCKSVCRFWT